MIVASIVVIPGWFPTAPGRPGAVVKLFVEHPVTLLASGRGYFVSDVVLPEA
ncbi:hypothetical protein J3D54_005557 [Pseudomonas sp. GGS8]|uniref:hypothetical protein n=1 Tax=Pseudomonas sp. GGS8 TaxID=2817892 RepID=UPI00209E25C7|nr:hypothetical protein [Pseudomonas sp. GGS8]MCP1446425.1 hypothetical protein [Pseudomonas sp. GGS8]